MVQPVVTRKRPRPLWIDPEPRRHHCQQDAEPDQYFVGMSASGTPGTYLLRGERPADRAWPKDADLPRRHGATPCSPIECGWIVWVSARTFPLTWMLATRGTPSRCSR